VLIELFSLGVMANIGVW